MPRSFSVDWFSRNIPVLETHLARFVGGAGLRFIEIGSFEGRSTCWFLDRVLTGPRSSLICIDTWEGSMEHHAGQKMGLWDVFHRNTAEYPNGKILVRRGRSCERLREIPLNTADFIYVDGSHTTKDSLSDAVLSFDILKKGALMAFDDYLWEGYPNQPLLNPKQGIDAFLHCYSGRYEILEKNYIVLIRKTED